MFRLLIRFLLTPGVRSFATAAFAAFATYFCMYAFRKPFAAARFNNLFLWGIDYKIILILAQVAGYTTSKFIGIRVIAEMRSERRAAVLIGMILFAELALVGFALTPPETAINAFCLFLNGLPLGMVYGLVFSYLEGRRATEALTAVLISSFIVATGVVKGIGLFVTNKWGVSDFWMPAVTGGLFLVPFILCVWILNQTLPPTPADIEDRTQRVPMDFSSRWRMLKSLSVGMLLLVCAHMALTALRDYRDKFTSEILGSMNLNSSGLVTTSELPIAIVVLVMLGGISLLRKHNQAVSVLHVIMLFGFALAGGSTLAFQRELIGGVSWFILVGAGIYLAYVPFHSMLFERLIALMRRPANAAYLIYIADATGYLSTVVVLLYKEFFVTDASHMRFFIQATLATSVIGFMVVGGALAFFLLTTRATTPSAELVVEPA